MSYTVRLEKKVSGQIEKRPKKTVAQVVRALEELEGDPRRIGVKKLVGRDGYRYRVGDYRILYLIDDLHREVIIYAILHRKDVYR